MNINKQLAESDEQIINFIYSYVQFLIHFEQREDHLLPWTVKEHALTESFLLINQLTFYCNMRDLTLERLATIHPQIPYPKERFAVVFKNKFSNKKITFDRFQVIFDYYFSKTFYPKARIIHCMKKGTPSTVWKNNRWNI